MSIKRLNPKVDEYLQKGCGRCEFYNTPQCKVNDWRDVLIELRQILIESGLKEDYKWKQPCYTINNKNVVILSAFRNYAALGFFKGALLKDKYKVLHSPGDYSQFSRLLKFTSVKDVRKSKTIIKEYLKEAIEIELSGKKIEKKSELNIPEEFQKMMDENLRLKEAFYRLTPGRQRGYIIYFSQPKKSETRISRIKKFIPKILEGKGFFDD